jgi:hypothetical protein
MDTNNEIRQLILKNCSSGEIREAARRNGMRTLADDGWRLVSQGVTTPEEVLRVTKDQSIGESAEQKLPQTVSSAQAQLAHNSHAVLSV